MVNLFIVIQILEIFAILASFVALGLLLFGEGVKEQKLMAFFMGGVLIQNCGYLLELLSTTMEAAVTATKMQYLGSLFVPLLYCWFIYYYCYEKVPEKFMEALASLNIVLLIIIFTCNYHTLYYRKLEWFTTFDGHHQYLHIQYGPIYWIFMVFSCAIPYSMSIYALIHSTYKRPEQAKRRRYRLILLLSLMPVLALISYASKITYIFDLTPSVLGITLSLVVILVWSRKTYDFRNLASGVVLESMADGVIVVDAWKCIVNFNQAATAIFPELNENMAGENIQYLKDLPSDILDDSSKDEYIREFTVNDRFYESPIQEIADKDKRCQGYIILILDVTDTQRYIEEIKSVREQAEKANMAKSEFLANMSHEIRTPMNAIIGLSDIIMEESRGRKVSSYANDINSAAQNLLTIINDILDLSKVEAGKMELVNVDYSIKTLVDEVLSMMDIVASQHGLLMKYDYDMSIPCKYHGDSGRIRQILINLSNNAVKFTKKGYVKISVGGERLNEKTELLKFSIEDTGVGIKEEDIDKIFENFKQVDSKRNRAVEGTGLGLSISKRFVELMNGTIDVKSVYGQGTTFEVTIPQEIVDERSLAEMPTDTEKNSEQQIKPFIVTSEYKVLIVDDNLVNRRVALGFLKSYGFELFEAASGFEAIELVKKTKYDMIFMDHMMPEMDGIEATHIIRDECGENGTSPIIIGLTANAMEGVKEMFLENGFQDFIPKPLFRKPLNEMLVKWIPESLRVEHDFIEDEDNPQADELDFSVIAIKGIDTDKIMSSGNVSDYLEILQLYYAEGVNKLNKIKELYESCDWKNYCVEVHGIKSASANIGAVKLSAKAKAHEDAAKADEIEYIRSNFSDLFSSYDELLKSIQEYFDTKNADSDKMSYGENNTIERTELLNNLKNALNLLENFDSKGCAHTIDDLLKYNHETAIHTGLKEIHNTLKLFDDDAAEEKIRWLIAHLEK